MPQFKMDEAFEAEIPTELGPYYRSWKAGRKNGETKSSGGKNSN
jgi:hypothetical protein